MARLEVHREIVCSLTFMHLFIHASIEEIFPKYLLCCWAYQINEALRWKTAKIMF